MTVLAESLAGERRVAIVPDVARRLVAQGWEVVVEAGAGARASYPDDGFRAAGATVLDDAGAALAGADMHVRINPPSVAEADRIPDGSCVISMLAPGAGASMLAVLAPKGVSYFSFDQLPRISRAQGMDALSSQATVSGYRSGILAAVRSSKFFPMFMTAAGTVPPAKVLVMGVGVAGLQAIATVRRLGAVVKAYDVRAAAREEAESVGATFLDLGVLAEGTGGYARALTDDESARLQDALADEVAASDAVITTAAVPGRRAPVLITQGMVERMAPGAVVVDMAADSGGNCEATVAGSDVVVGGTIVVGLSNPASDLPTHASLLYSRNVLNLLELFVRDATLVPDWDDEIVAGTCVLQHGSPPTIRRSAS